jgi:hypothetical protein
MREYGAPGTSPFEGGGGGHRVESPAPATRGEVGTGVGAERRFLRLLAAAQDGLKMPSVER